nr:transmembrane protein 163a-like [Pocillopora verrucosa]
MAMEDTTKYGTSTVLLTSVSDAEEKPKELEGFPCISPMDDDYLLHKEKQIPTQLMDRWRKAALVISYASVFTTFVIGVCAFVISTLARSSAAFGFAFDSLLDVCSSLVVIWRFCGLAGQTYSWERERRACIAIAALFVLSGTGIFIRAVRSLIVEKHPIRFTGVEAISGVSLVAFTILAWIKFVTAEKLHSESLRTDAINSTAGAIMALGIIISTMVHQYSSSIWYLDASIALCIALGLFGYGIRLLANLLSSKGKAAPPTWEGFD